MNEIISVGSRIEYELEQDREAGRARYVPRPKVAVVYHREAFRMLPRDSRLVPDDTVEVFEFEATVEQLRIMADRLREIAQQAETFRPGPPKGLLQSTASDPEVRHG